MAQVRPFRALRYSPAAGPLRRLVAPPYDVISAQEREHYLALDPHNVVHLTLPESEEQAARELSDWQADGMLERETEPAVWALSQSYTGPDGVAPAAPAADADPARADLPAARRRPGRDSPARAGPRRGGRPALARRGRSRRALRRRAAPDRRRPPPLRDRTRLPRGGRHGRKCVDDGRARLDPRAGIDDLPDPPARPVRRRRPRDTDRRAGRRAPGGCPLQARRL